VRPLTKTTGDAPPMNTCVTVTTGSRLHFGPFACGATEGRRFGGIGVMIDAPQCVVEIRTSESDRIDAGRRSVRVADTIAAYRASVGGNVPPVHVRLQADIPSHRGFGSGTQLALAIARALSIVTDEVDVTAAQLAQRVGRGTRSAVGTHGFELGGLIVDAGKDSSDQIGALAARVELPADWRWLLVTPVGRGVSGDREHAAMASLPPMGRATTQRLRGMIEEELLPAARNGVIGGFGEALRCYGEIVGEYFSPVQGGTFADPRMAELSAWFAERGVLGVAQSSWGPSVAALLPNCDLTMALRAELQQTEIGRNCELCVAVTRNVGATAEAKRNQ